MTWTERIRETRLKARDLLPFQFRELADKVILTHTLGDHAILSPSEFVHLLENRLPRDSPAGQMLAERGFYTGTRRVEQIEKYAARKAFLRHGPTLHAFVLTERCNHGCQYCHSSVVGMERTETDMSLDTAEKAVDIALSTTSPWLTIEFQGGEPMANWDALTHIVRTARERNPGKELTFSLVTNFSLMTEERFEWLLENHIQVCTSLDGPEDLHNGIRIWSGGNSHAVTTHWIERFNRGYADMGLDPTLYRVEALPTITRASLSREQDLVDEFVSRGCRAIFLRKLDPFGFAARTRQKLGYSMDEFLAFYRRALDYIIAQNLAGVEVLERNAAIMLAKIIGGYEPNYLDLRTPGGAAIGQLAYHPDGGVYSSDEGRMIAAMGDDTFRIGDVHEDSYHDILSSETVRALVLASTNEAHPDCVQCAWQPFCGQQPEYNYKTQGSIFGRMRDSDWCRKHKGIFDILMTRWIQATPEEQALLERWTIQRPREHFLTGETPGEQP